MTQSSDLSEWTRRVRLFEVAAHGILAKHETSRSRIIEVSATYAKLDALSLQQDELLRQSLRCVENELYRAAHVMAWAAFMDFLEERIGGDGFKKLGSVRKNWNVSSVEDLRERYPEHQIVEAARDLGLMTRTTARALLGLLSKRNECAHPSDYYPQLNESLGYISEVMQRIEQVRTRTP